MVKMIKMMMMWMIKEKQKEGNPHKATLSFSIYFDIIIIFQKL